MERADQRVNDATAAATGETARLTETCGSIDGAAEILGLDPREVRRATASASVEK